MWASGEIKTICIILKDHYNHGHYFQKSCVMLHNYFFQQYQPLQNIVDSAAIAKFSSSLCNNLSAWTLFLPSSGPVMLTQTDFSGFSPRHSGCLSSALSACGPDEGSEAVCWQCLAVPAPSGWKSNTFSHQWGSGGSFQKLRWEKRYKNEFHILYFSVGSSRPCQVPELLV